ncbi:MAG TPA: biopolymer transporter ExbD [Bdellovibrionota bacterium]|nr:biopolymer transporter ExbD [Bdellovibrionota bacterium]
MGFGFGKKRQQTASASLNLTPMIDMMTILLVFLIKNYSTDPSYLTNTQSIELSRTTSETSAPDKPVLIIGKDGVLLDGQTLVSFPQGVPSKAYLNAKVIPELMDALEVKKSSDADFTGTLILQADKAVPYTTLKPVLRTAGVAGFNDIKFAGVTKE